MRALNAGLILVVFLTIIVWIIPSRAIPNTDDFAYLDSVVGTLRAQQWKPCDFLEPLNFTLTALSAISYSVTGNFYLSTFGLSVLFAGLNFVLLGILLKPQIGHDLSRWLIVLGLSLLPVWLYKAVGFTGVPIGITCMLLAWFCWFRDRHALFFVCVLAGFLNRQSALCLLAWPVVTLARQATSRQRLDWKLLAGTTLTLVVAITVLVSAPSTWARDILNAKLMAGFLPTTFFACMASALVVLAAGRAGWMILCGAPICSFFQANLKRPLIPMCCMIAGTAIVFHGGNILWHTPDFGYGLVIFGIATAIGAWLNRWDHAPPIETTVFILAYTALVSLRGWWSDYYFLDPLLAIVCGSNKVFASKPKHNWLAALLVLGAASTVFIKSEVNDSEGMTIAYEQALRNGELSIVELSDAPMGLLGWKLFATARTHPGAEGILDFLKYVEGSRARYRNGNITVRRDAFRKSIHPSLQKWQVPAGYVHPWFPLNNAEWRDHIAFKDRAAVAPESR